MSVYEIVQEYIKENPDDSLFVNEDTGVVWTKHELEVTGKETGAPCFNLISFDAFIEKYGEDALTDF